MQRKLNYFLIPLLLVIGYLILSFKLPKYSGQYIFMVLLFFADLYLWTSVSKQIFSYRKWLKSIFVLIYWLPLLMVVGLMTSSVFVPITEWNDQFRTLLFGFILVFYVAKLLPVIFLILADIVRVIDKIFSLFNKAEREKIEEEGISRSKFLQYLGYISGGLVLGTMFTGMFKWVYDFKVFEHKIKLPNLPAGF